MASELYPWQQKCLASWAQNEYHGIVNAITGAGKTRLALAGISKLNAACGSKLRVKIVVPGKSLLFQWKQALQNTLPTEEKNSVGICASGNKISSEKKHMIYVINSARYRLARQILDELKEGCTVLLIADECHNYTGSENRKIFEFLPYLPELAGKYCSLGLSATTEKTGYETILVPALGKEIYRYSLKEAVRKGTVCDFSIWQIAVNFQPEELAEYEDLSEALRHTRLELLRLFPWLKFCEGKSFFAHMKELAGQEKGKGSRLAKNWLQLSYKRKHTVHMASSRISCVYQLLKELGLQRQILIFGESISQIEQLYALLNHIYPAKTGRYHSQMGAMANKNALERFRSGELRILLTCRALDEGIDVPEASIGIILSGTSMERQRLQRLGRILRKHDGKKMACLYYLFIGDSLEEKSYFPTKSECFRALNLFYDDKKQEFCFPAYEKAAENLLADMAVRNLPENIYSEMLSCLQKGYFREDWMLSSEECRKYAGQASSIREQNYWLCMAQMANQYHAQTSLKHW